MTFKTNNKPRVKQDSYSIYSDRKSLKLDRLNCKLLMEGLCITHAHKLSFYDKCEYE